ncbi:hypothetical protein OIE66_32055 [Nonomuraea sp. NBC_01738]|uniref:hypothetical protein n=1 Tax=Nonomuraea sp. NBC_01738 TaxID=2976003 RepID=UPI002E15CE3D|nr:hypothetical protein OIE66_32055 [Nonomuraea sp. NBC_01738]
MRQYGGNRVGLAIMGVFLLGLGVYAYLRGQDRLPGLNPRGKILPGAMAESAVAHPWALWLLALVMVTVALVTLRWLLLSLGWGRRGSRTGTGTAMLTVGLKDVDGLSRAGVRVVGDVDRLRIGLTCPAATDVGMVVGKLDREIVGRIRREVCDNDLGSVVRLHVKK